MREKFIRFGNNAWAFIRKNIFYILTIAVVIISFAMNFTDVSSRLVESEDDKTDLYKSCFVIISVVLLGVVILLSKFVGAKKNNYQKLFVIIAIVFGGIYLCLSPLFTGSDERSHYYRIYEISDGVIRTPVADGVVNGELPSSLYETLRAGGLEEKKVKYDNIPDMMGVPLDKNNTMIYNQEDYSAYYVAASLYSPVSYIPHLVGFSIGKVFNLGPYYIGMLGRVFNLIFYILIGYFAIKTAPKGKLFYLLVLLSPNMLHCATVLSADAFINVCILLFIAMIMKTRLNDEIMTYPREVLLAVLSVVISLCKICYLPFVAFLFFIRKGQYKKGGKEKYIYVAIVSIIAIICSLLWLKGVNSIMELEYPKSVLQKEFILSEPFGYLGVLFNTIADSFVISVEGLFGGTMMYHAQIIIPAFVSLFYAGVVLLSTTKKEKKSIRPLSDLERVVIIVVCCIIAVLILTALYMQFTAMFYGVAFWKIMGIQGRYFIPIVLCLPFVIKWKKTRDLDERKMLASSFAVTLIVWFHMMNQFII